LTAAIPKSGRISRKDGFRRFLKYFVLLVLAPLGVIQKALAILPNRLLIKKKKRRKENQMQEDYEIIGGKSNCTGLKNLESSGCV